MNLVKLKVGDTPIVQVKTLYHNSRVGRHMIKSNQTPHERSVKYPAAMFSLVPEDIIIITQIIRSEVDL